MSTMAGENVKIPRYGMAEIDHFHHGWRKYWNTKVWNGWNWSFLPWLEKILNYHGMIWLKLIISIMVGGNCEIPRCQRAEINHFHHGWRKCWNSKVWNGWNWSFLSCFGKNVKFQDMQWMILIVFTMVWNIKVWNG